MLRMFWWVTRNVCLRARVYVCDRCVCTRILRRRYQEGEWAFEVTEEVGHVIVQPCVLVRARVYVHAWFFCKWVWVCMHGSSETALWCNTNWCLPSLSLRVLRRPWELICEHFPSTMQKQVNSNVVLSWKERYIYRYLAPCSAKVLSLSVGGRCTNGILG